MTLANGFSQETNTVSAAPIVNTSKADPYVMKIYPDGTKVILRWSEIGRAIDQGEAHGGPPKIVAYEAEETSGFVVESSPGALHASPAPQVWQRREAKQGLVAGSPFEGFYIWPELGVSVVQDIQLNTISASAEISGVRINTQQSPYLTFTPGIRFGVGMGYAFNDWFSMEFGPSLLWNPLNVYGDDDLSVSIDGDHYRGSAEINLDGAFYQVPLMTNFLFHIPTNSPWRPFVGGGVGANFNYLNITKVLGYSLSDANGSCWSFGYQAIAGVEYAFEGKYSLGLKYIFTGSTAQSFGGDLQPFGTNGSFTQSVVLDFKYAF